MFEPIQIDCAVIDTQLVHAEEGDCYVLLIQIYYLHKDFSAVDFPLCELDAIVENGDAVDFVAVGHEKAGPILQLLDFLIILDYLSLELVTSAHDFVLALDGLNHSFQIKHFPLNEPPQNLIRILHLLLEVVQPVLQVPLLIIFKQNKLLRIILLC